MDEILRQLASLQQQINELKTGSIYGTDIAPHVVAQRHIKDGLLLFIGDIADRPSDGGTEKQAYYALDEKKLYVWNTTNNVWESATFS